MKFLQHSCRKLYEADGHGTKCLVVSLAMSVGHTVFVASNVSRTYRVCRLPLNSRTGFALAFSGFAADTNLIQIPEILVTVKGTSNNKLVWNFRSDKVLPVSNTLSGHFHQPAWDSGHWGGEPLAPGEQGSHGFPRVDYDVIKTFFLQPWEWVYHYFCSMIDAIQPVSKERIAPP